MRNAEPRKSVRAGSVAPWLSYKQRTPYESTVTFWWSPPGGLQITHYQLEIGSAPGAADIARAPLPATTTYVEAGNVPSNEVRFRSLQGPCRTPPPPPQLIDPFVSGGTMSLQWDHSSTNATSYVLEAGSGPGLADLGVFEITSRLALRFSGVPAGTYFSRVRAWSSCGIGAPSDDQRIIIQ